MSGFITWEQINDYDYFAFGLQPLDEETLEPIPCPNYCHKYRPIYDRLYRYESFYHPSMENKLAEWKQKLKQNNLKPINVRESIPSNQDLQKSYIRLLGSLSDSISHFFNAFCVTLKDIKKIEVAFKKEKGKHNDRMETLEKIVSKDQYVNSWKFFKMPDSEKNVNKLNNLLKKAFFKRKDVNKIAKIALGKKQHSQSSNLEDKLNEELKKIHPELEKFYNALIEEIDLIGGMGSINEIEQPDLYQTALNYFDNAPVEYRILTKRIIDDESLYKYSFTRRRMLVGNILKKYFQLKLPAALAHKKIKTTKDALLIKYNKIKGH